MIALGFGGVVAIIGVCVALIAAYLVYRAYLRYRWIPRIVIGRTRFDYGPFVDLVANAVHGFAETRLKIRGALAPLGTPAATASAAMSSDTVFGLPLAIRPDPARGDDAFRQAVTYFVTALTPAAAAAVDKVVSLVYHQALVSRLRGRKKSSASGSPTEDVSRWSKSWIVTHADLSTSALQQYVRDYGEDTIAQLADTKVTERDVRRVVRDLVGDDDFLSAVEAAGDVLAALDTDWRKFGTAADVVSLARWPDHETVKVGSSGEIQFGFPKADTPLPTETFRAVLGTVSATVEVMSALRKWDSAARTGVLTCFSACEEDSVPKTGRAYRSGLMTALHANKAADPAIRKALDASAAAAVPVVTGGVPWSLDLAVHLRLLEILLDIAERQWTDARAAAVAANTLTGADEVRAQDTLGVVVAVMRSEVQLMVAKHSDDVTSVLDAFHDLDVRASRLMYRRAFVSADVFLKLKGDAKDLAAHAAAVDDIAMAATYLPDVRRIRTIKAKPTVRDVLEAYYGFVRTLSHKWPLSVLRCNGPLLNPVSYYNAHKDSIVSVSQTWIDMLVTFVDVPGNVFRNAVCRKKCD